MLRTLGEQHCRLGIIDDRDQHCSRTDGPNFGDLAHYRIGIMIATHGRDIWIGETRRHVERQTRSQAREKLLRRKCRQRMLHQVKSRTASASTMAKNSPCEATPNIALPSMSRSSPSATRS